MQTLSTRYKVGLKCERKVIQTVSMAIPTDISFAACGAMPSTRSLASPSVRQALVNKQTSAGFREDVRERE